MSDDPKPPASEDGGASPAALSPAADTTPRSDAVAGVAATLEAPDDAPEPEAPPPPPPPPPSAAPPFVDRSHPSCVALAGGRVALVGASFAEGVAVRIASETLAVERVDPTLLRVTVTARDAVGPATLVVENPDGKSARFTIEVVRGPRVDRLSPAEGPRSGATEVAIEGDGFEAGAAIAFFDEHAPAVIFDGPTRLVFTTPPRSEVGAGDVVVTNPDGTSFRARGAFAYRDAEPPRVDAVEPPRAWVTGGARLVVRGAHFAPGAVVRVGGADAQTTFESPERLVALAPAGPAAGPAAFAVTNPDGAVASRDDVFRYDRVPTPPKLVGLSPDRGPTAGGQTIVLSGDNFDASTIVRVGEVSALTRLLGPTQIEVITPPREAPGPVTIELVGEGVAIRRDDAYTYEARPAPHATSVTPNRGPVGGGTKVVIEGEHFAADCAVRIGREPVPQKLLRSPTRFEVTTPAIKSPGAADVEVVAPGLPPSVLKNGFFFDAVPPPVISSVSPQRGGTGGGTELSIDGKAFAAGCAVIVGGKPCKKVKLLGPTSIEAIAPPGEHGQMVDVVVKNPDGKEAVAKRAFQYDERYR